MTAPKIATITEKKLVGKKMRLPLMSNRTPELWRSFMPYLGLIENRVSNDLVSMQIYNPGTSFKDIRPGIEIDKWATAEVSTFDAVPGGMETYTLQGGLYAVFLYKGTPEQFGDMFRYIYFEWLPQSGYELDEREHFEILGEKYKRNDPESEEEIWVPVKLQKVR